MTRERTEMQPRDAAEVCHPSCAPAPPHDYSRCVGSLSSIAPPHLPTSLAVGDAQPDRDCVLDIATPLDKLIHVSLTDTAATCVDRFFKGNVRQMTHDRSQ